MTKTKLKPATEVPRKSTRVAEGKSARMVRKQILLTPEQSRRLKGLSVAVGRTEAELVREAIDAKLASDPNQAWKAAILAVVADWPADSEIEARIAEGRAHRATRRARLSRDGDK
jgi:hypothetical protein